MTEKVSVIIPTKNRIDTTLRCLNSVINQSLSPFEIIVVDDGSSDGTTKKIKENFPEVKILQNKFSRGGAVARNQGACIATGDYFAFLDSDDEWLPQHLKNKVNLIKSDNSQGAFGTFILQKGKEGNPISFNIDHHSNGNIGNSILSAIRFDARTSTFVFRKEAFLKIKFDEKLKKHQDWDLAINFDKRYRLTLDKQPTVKIYVEQEEERMSQKLQHDSSFYFIKKNSPSLNSNSIFIFCVKQIMRSQLSNEPIEIIDHYILVAAEHYKKFNLRNKILFKLIQSGIINIGFIYRILSKIRS